MAVIFTGLVVAISLYLLVPGIAALAVSRRWRQFRRRIVNSSHLPVYPAGQHGGEARAPDNGARANNLRFFGKLEAIEDGDIVWLNDGVRRVRVRLESCSVYTLPGASFQDQDREKSPMYTRWDQLDNLPEGINFFVAGHLNTQSKIPIFENSPDTSPDDGLIVVIHEAQEPLFFSLAMRTGRQRNAFWNSITAPSLLVGMIIELLLLVLPGGISNTQFLLLASFAILPGVILAPPGIGFFFLYRTMWRRGQRYFVESDLDTLLLRSPNKKLPRGLLSQCLALFFFCVGVLINVALVDALLFLFLLLNG